MSRFQTTLQCLVLATAATFATSAPAAAQCSVSGPTQICAGTQVMHTVNIANGVSYSWIFTFNSSGASFCGPTNQQTVCVQSGTTGFYRAEVTVQLAGGGTAVCAVEPFVSEPVSTSEMADQQACDGDKVVTFVTIASSANVTYAWTKDGAPIPGATGPMLVISPVTLGDAGTYCVTVTATRGCQNQVTECAQLTVKDCEGEEFCTLTQGAYGSAGGLFQGMGTLDLLTSLLSTDLTLGKPGRSLTFSAGMATAQCILQRLPGGGPAVALPNFGDQTLSVATCQTVPALPLQNSGRFRNILLAQTLTLALNMRLDTDLGGFELCEVIVTQSLEDPLDVQTFTIPSSVLTALGNLGLGDNVSDLLELANRALAGQPTGGASLSEIAGAAGTINEAFDECRLVVSCTSGKDAR